jgi:C1A family cysteine protease
VAPRLGLRPVPIPGFHFPKGFTYSPLGRTYASSFDLRTLGKVTPVKDQDPHGTCWAFAACASMESCLLTGESWDFSEDNLAYFHGFDLGYEHGGSTTMAAAYLTRWTGPVTEAQDPYNDGVHPDPSSLTVQKHVQNIVYLPPRSSCTANDDFKYALTTWGAVDVTMYWSDGAYDRATSSYYYHGPTSVGWNHAVAMVGWDDNYPASNFSPAAPGKGAFLIKNSWGTGWGDAGYFWVSYYDVALGYDDSMGQNIQAAVFYGAEPTDD